jgi:hypothetical protein
MLRNEEEEHVRIASIMIGLGFTAVISFVAYLALYDTPYYTQLNCSRVQNICVVQQLTIAHSRPSWSLPLSNLRDAQVHVFPARRGAPRISVYLVTATDSYYFADYSGRARAQADAAHIRQFLSSTESQLSLMQDDRSTFYLIGFGFVVVLVLLIVLWRVLLRVALTPRASTLAVDTQPAAS